MSYRSTQPVAAAASLVALIAALGMTPAAAQQAAAPPTPSASQVEIRPVTVTASQPKAKKKRRAPVVARTRGPAASGATAAGGLAGGPNAGGQATGTRPVAVQNQTQIGRLSPAAPLHGSILERRDIEQVRGGDLLRELMRRVPGISLVRNIRIPNGGKGYTNNLVDGYSPRSASLGNVGFVDDVNTFDIDGIEVTRGPGSVLHSSKGIGGTINIITRTPPKVPELAFSAEGGAFGFQRQGVFAGGSNQAGTFGYTFSANHLKDDGWRERTEREKTATSAKFVFTPTDRTEITVRGEFVNSYKEFPGTLTRAQFNNNWRQAVPKNLYENLNYATGMVAMKQKIGDAGLLDLAYMVHHNFGLNGCPAGCSNSVVSTGRITDVNYLTNNFRALYRHDFDFLKSRVNVGMDTFLSNKNDYTYNRIGFVRGALNSAFAIDERTLAPFLQYEFSPIDRLRFTLGARYEDYTLDVDDRRGARDGRKHYSALVKKVGATYEFIDNHRLWANISEGFYVPDTASTVSGLNAKDLPPEKSLTYGLGVRGKFEQAKLSYDVGLYETTIRNQAVSLSCGTPATALLCPDSNTGADTYPVAAGKVRFRGVESTIGWQPWSFLRLDATHTYGLNEFIDFRDSTGNYSGKLNSASPKHHLNARLTVYPIDKLRVEFELDHISSYFTNTRNTDSYQRPVLANLRVAYAVNKNVEIWGHALNLFNVKYADRISSTNVATPVRSYSEGYIPLTVRAGTSVKW